MRLPGTLLLLDNPEQRFDKPRVEGIVPSSPADLLFKCKKSILVQAGLGFHFHQTHPKSNLVGRGNLVLCITVKYVYVYAVTMWF